MRKLLLVVAAVGFAAMSVVAQHDQPRADPDRKMAGPGTLPSGWKGRLDSGDKSLAGVKAAQMGGGVHFMTGPAGIYYKPAGNMSGGYKAHPTLTHMGPGGDAEARGLFLARPGLERAGARE